MSEWVPIEHTLILKLSLQCNKKNVDHNWEMIKCYYWESKLQNVIVIQCSTACTESFMIGIFCDKSHNETISFLEEFLHAKLEKSKISEIAVEIICQDMCIKTMGTQSANSTNVRPIQLLEDVSCYY